MDDSTSGNEHSGAPGYEGDDPPPEAERHLLIALFPDRGVQLAIEKHREDWLWPKGHRFPSSARLHLTLNSLPDTSDEESLACLRTALAEVRMEPLQLTLASSCTWKNDISVVLLDEHDKLRALRSDIAHAVKHAGYETRRAEWTPHITIARHARGAARPPSLDPVLWTSTHFALVRSHPWPYVRHEVLTSYRAR